MSEHEYAGAEIRTPWGDASELRHRRLFPGSGTPPAEVARNQRERLFGAMVAVVAEKGYEATTVADVLTLSGVSRSAFYRHFAGKSDCMLAAMSEMLEAAIEALGPTGGDRPRHDPQQIFERFFALIGSQSAAARAYFVELPAAGPEGDAIGDRAVELLAAAIEEAPVGPNGEGGHDPALTRALIDGLRKLVHSRLIRGEAEELRALAPDLWRWILTVTPPPGRLESPRRQRAVTGPTFRGYTPAERIAGAVADVVAERGYARTSTDAIAARASISLSTFYAHFTDKEDAVLAALEMGGAQITALAVPAARRAGDWTEGVRILYEAICAYFAAEPAMAELALVAVYGAGPRACRRRDRVLDQLAAMLAPGYGENRSAPAISGEAIGATVYALLRDKLRREGPQSLATVVPLATYVTLVGFIGPERALSVANGRTAR